jgi:hypothetical protein
MSENFWFEKDNQKNNSWSIKICNDDLKCLSNS